MQPGAHDIMLCICNVSAALRTCVFSHQTLTIPAPCKPTARKDMACRFVISELGLLVKIQVRGFVLTCQLSCQYAADQQRPACPSFCEAKATKARKAVQGTYKILCLVCRAHLLCPGMLRWLATFKNVSQLTPKPCSHAATDCDACASAALA